jgi:HAE1 family hydrophobic/amphiphilic exporter-1
VNPVRFSVERPHTIAVGAILALLFSTLAYRNIPVQLKPTVDTPVISIETYYRGASAAEVEEQVTRVIEDVVQNCEGVEELTSSSSEGYSVVSLEYNWGVDKDATLVDVMNKLAEMQQPLPPDAEKPIVSLVPPMQREAAMWLVSRSPYPPDRVRQIVVDLVEPQLKRVPGVGGLMVFGGEEREIQVRVDPVRLVGFGVTWNEVEAALRRGHVNVRGGTIETPTQQMVVRTEGKAVDPKEIGQIVVRRDERGTIRVADVAVVVDAYKERTSFVRGDGSENIALGVNRQAGANVVELIRACDEELVEINRRLADKGLEVRFESVYRDTTYLGEALDFVTGNLVVGALLAVAVLLIFLRSFRSVIVISVAIPISLLMVFLVMQWLGRTLNVISLAGLAFASGMVVDNAIVVLENFFRHREMGKRPLEAAVDGGREMWGGILASTLTTMAVFLPVLGIEEEAGQLFADLAITISSAVGFSLLVALLVVPPLCSLLWRRRATLRAGEATGGGLVTQLYGRVLSVLTGPGGGGVMHRIGLVLLIGAGCALAVERRPAASYLPAGNSNFIFYLAQPYPNSRIEEVADNLGRIEEWIRDQPETYVYFSVAAQNFNGGGVILLPEYASARGLEDYEKRMGDVGPTIPGFRYLLPMRFSLFNDPGSQFEVRISGPDLETLERAANYLQGRLMGVQGVSFARSSYVAGRPELKVRVDPHKATEQGLSIEQVGAIVEIALAGRRVSLFSAGGRDYDVNLLVPPSRVRSEEELRALPIVTARGTVTTLGDLASIERRTGPVSIDRYERERSILLAVSLAPDAVLGDVISRAQRETVEPLVAALPTAYHVDLGGSADKLSTTLRALTRSFWLAILVTYLLLVALFRSWLSPFVILVTVPLAMSGGVVAIALAMERSPNASFDVITMLGFVILAGIVVNNAILIVHQANNFVLEGMERRRALAESARTRLRPITMTVITTVCGLLPLAFGSGAGSELYQGLGVVLVGGLVASTIFTLFLVPALVTLGYDVADAVRGGRREAREQVAREAAA